MILNVDMLQPLNAVHQPHNSKYFQIFMNQRILQIQIDISPTKYKTLIDHVWTNVPSNYSKASSIEAY